MISTQKLISYIHHAPFPKPEQDRLVRLANAADETFKKRIYFLVKKYTDQFAQDAKNIRAKGKQLKLIMRRKAEEIYSSAETQQLRDLEALL